MVFWLDLGVICDVYGLILLLIFLLEFVIVNMIVDVLGFGNLGVVVIEFGFKGEVVWNEIYVQVQGQLEGLFVLVDQSLFILKDLLLLLVDISGFVVVSFDVGWFYDMFLGLVMWGVKFGLFDVVAQVEVMIVGILQMIGFDLQLDLFQMLGSMVCFYLDGGQFVFLIFGGLVLVVEVKDVVKFCQIIDYLVVMVQGASDGELEVQ